MKKLKLLPSILMLVLCVGVLAVGVFAITPTENQITGSITVNASNIPVKLEFFLDDDETNKITHKAVRGGEDFKFSDILGEDGVFEYDLSSANKIWEVPVKKMTVRVTNLSETQSVGAYYLKSELSSTSLIDPYDELYATNGTKVANVTMPSYTIIDAGESAEMWMEFALEWWAEETSTANIEYYLYVEQYGADITTEYEETTNSIICSEGTSGIVNAVVPEGTTSLEREAFSGYSTLQTVALPSTLERLESDAFCEVAITEITLPKALKSSDVGSICDMSNLTKVDCSRCINFDQNYDFVNYISSLKEVIFTDVMGEWDKFFISCVKLSTVFEKLTIIPTEAVLEIPENCVLPTLSKDGATFDGWYVNELDGTETEVTKLTDRDYIATYYPKWN